MRKNTVTWVDGKVLTALMGDLQISLMEWQKFAYDAQFNGANPFGGDSGVIVHAIILRDKLSDVIDRSLQANKKD